jgi:hypothetical protein
VETEPTLEHTDEDADDEPTNANSADSHRPSTAPVPATLSEINWLELAGDSVGERLKTALAILGGCTLIWHTVRLLCGPRTTATSATG